MNQDNMTTKENGTQIALITFIVGLAISLSCCINFIPMSQTKEEATKETEDAIRRYEWAKELDDICSQVPVFRDYKLDSKGSGTNRKFVEHIFASPTEKTVNYPELRKFYLQYFSENQWQLVEDRDFGSRSLKFDKDGFEVQIFYATDRGMEWGRLYSIGCKKTN